MNGRRAAFWSLFGLLILLSLAAVLELSGRCYYVTRRHLPWNMQPADFVFMYYPELTTEMARYEPGAYNILLLGGSSLHREHTRVAEMLETQLEASLQHPVAVIDLAVPSHSSLDSDYKYRELFGVHFDAVVVYDSINELRANNAPDDVWRDDYSHYAWYDEINFYFGHPWLRRLPTVIPQSLKQCEINIGRKLVRRNRYVPPHDPRPEWMAYGATVKTARPFRRHLEDIAQLARERGEPVVFMTFAFCLPSHYSMEAYRAGALPYAKGPWGKEVELWGRPEYIVKGLRAQLGGNS